MKWKTRKSIKIINGFNLNVIQTHASSLKSDPKNANACEIFRWVDYAHCVCVCFGFFVVRLACTFRRWPNRSIEVKEQRHNGRFILIYTGFRVFRQEKKNGAASFSSHRMGNRTFKYTHFVVFKPFYSRFSPPLRNRFLVCDEWDSCDEHNTRNNVRRTNP